MHSRLPVFAFLCAAAISHAADPLPGHSVHGEAFNEGPRQAAVLISGTGKVDFAITTSKEETRPFFNQGVGQLHGFWYYEAERSFRQVALLDKDCAMAYWGMAMANVNNDTRAKAFVKKASELKPKAGAREKLWIASLETFYKEDKRDKKQRALDFIRDLEAIVQDYPEDVEAKAFLAWKIWHAKDVAPISSPQAVDALLDQVFAANPQHPAHHYRIHLWDGSKPARALKSAAQNGQAAPGIAHMWHMPGHTFSKLNRHDDAAWQQEASTRADHAYMTRNWILPDQIHNYAHNEEWLVRTFNELGRAKDAKALARTLIANPRHPKYNKLDKGSANYGPQRLMDTLVKWELWDELLEVSDSALISPMADNDALETARLRARGLAFYERKDVAALEAVQVRLYELNRAALARQKEAAKQAAKKEPTKQPEKNAKPDAGGKVGGRKEGAKPAVGPAEGALRELAALRAVLAGRKDATTALDAAAKDMPKDRAARAWLKQGDRKKVETLLKEWPQDLVGNASKTEVLLELGRKDEAKRALEQTGKQAFAMDGDLPVVARLDAAARQLGIQEAWRSNAPSRKDSGSRPPLVSLGSMDWQPPKAPQWQAVTLDGKPVDSATFAGKPHILLFYLGSACGHCMEQINAFGKAAGGFKKAGIRLAAVTLEPISLASRITDHTPDKKLPPFDICCDPGLDMFKSFKAYDDFEQEPLHAAVLVDAQGRARWWDVSWEPFKDTDFLLKEAQRLLGLP